jgi:type III secretion system YscI/HrpB-like protein
MANIIAGKAGAQAINPSQQLKPLDGQKVSPSKFDKIRTELSERLASSLQLPPAVTQVSDQQKKVLASELQKRLSEGGAQSPKDLMKVEMKNAQEGIDKLNRAVSAMPSSSAFDPLRQRLKDIEGQFQASGNLLNELGKSNSPQDLLKMQMQIYQVTQNVEILTKVVDGVSQGIRTMMQVQV